MPTSRRAYVVLPGDLGLGTFSLLCIQYQFRQSERRAKISLA
jgi:hypothetical protein